MAHQYNLPTPFYPSFDLPQLGHYNGVVAAQVMHATFGVNVVFGNGFLAGFVEACSGSFTVPQQTILPTLVGIRVGTELIFRMFLPEERAVYDEAYKTGANYGLNRPLATAAVPLSFVTQFVHGFCSAYFGQPANVVDNNRFFIYWVPEMAPAAAA